MGGTPRLSPPSTVMTWPVMYAAAALARNTVAAAMSPTDCDGAKIKSYNHHVCCAKVQELVAPESLAELEKTITSARHVRVVANSHTSNEQICTDGVAISVANFNQIHGLRRRGL